MYTTLKDLAHRAGVCLETVRRDTRRGLLRTDKSQGIKGFRIPVTGKLGANEYLRKKYPQVKLIDP